MSIRLGIPPRVNDAARFRILDGAEQFPKFNAAELAAVLTRVGAPITADMVRVVLEGEQ